MLLTISYSESYSSRTAETTFVHNSEICLLLFLKNKKYLLHVVDNIIIGISVPDYPRKTVETTFLGQS